MIRKNISILLTLFFFFSSTLIYAEVMKEYINDNLGIKLMVPEDWQEFDKGHHGAIVEFRRDNTAVPAFGISVHHIADDPAIKTALDFSKTMADEYRLDPNINILEESREMVVNGIPISVFSFETKEPAYKSIFYQLLASRDIMTIFAVYEFGSQYEKLLEVLNSIQLDDAEHSYWNLFLMRTAAPDFHPVDSAGYAILKNSIIEALDSVGSFKARYVIRDPTNDALADVDYKTTMFNMSFISEQEFEVEKTQYPDMALKTWRVVGETIYEKFKTWMESPDLSFDVRVDPRVNKIIAAKRDFYKFLSMKKYEELFRTEDPSGIFDDQANHFYILDFEPKNTNVLLLNQNDLRAEQCRLWVWVDKDDKMIRLTRLVFRGFDADGRPIKHKHDHYFRAMNEQLLLGAPPLP